MELYLRNIDEGFISSDANQIYFGLKAYFENCRDKIRFQMHPLGFKYFKLGDITSTEQLRLHLWIKTTENQDDDLQVHDHSFNFKSFVVYGMLMNHLYEPIYENDADGFIYNVKFRNEKSRLILNSAKQKLVDLKSEKLTTGNFYNMRCNEFHKTENLAEPSLTLLKMTKSITPAVDNFGRVYSPKKLSKLSKFEREYLKENDNEIMINEVLKLIELGERTMNNNINQKQRFN